MKQILMANDLSVRSDRALKRALSLAVDLKAELEILTVIEEMFFEETTRQSEDFARNAIREQLARHPESSHASVKQTVIVGLDYEDILKRAEDVDADLIVLGTHRHKDEKLFRGTTAERVVRYGSRPVLVVKDQDARPYHRILVATDLSTHAQLAAQTAAHIAPTGNLVFLHVLGQSLVARFGLVGQSDKQRANITKKLNSMIQQSSESLGKGAPQSEIRLQEGDVLEVVHAEIASLKPNLLTVGTHGRSGIAHALIGSVAEALLASCPIDIMVVKD